FNPSSVVLMDNEGRIQSLNGNAERLLSTTEANAVGKVYTEVFGDSLASRVFSLVLKGTKADVRTIEATLPGGRRARLRATAGPLRDERGAVNGIVFVADEDTSSPKLEELAQREERLRGALRRYLGDSVADLVNARPSFVDVGGRTQTGAWPRRARGGGGAEGGAGGASAPGRARAPKGAGAGVGVGGADMGSWPRRGTRGAGRAKRRERK